MAAAATPHCPRHRSRTSSRRGGRRQGSTATVPPMLSRSRFRALSALARRRALRAGADIVSQQRALGDGAAPCRPRRSPRRRAPTAALCRPHRHARASADGAGGGGVPRHPCPRRHGGPRMPIRVRLRWHHAGKTDILPNSVGGRQAGIPFRRDRDCARRVAQDTDRPRVRGSQPSPARVLARGSRQSRFRSLRVLIRSHPVPVHVRSQSAWNSRASL